jgi:hypothetical protein
MKFEESITVDHVHVIENHRIVMHTSTRRPYTVRYWHT